MKTFKKIFIALAIFAVSAFGAFAEDDGITGQILGGLDGVCARDAYEEQASDPDYAYQIADLLVQQIGTGEITELYSFDESTDDEEDKALIDNIKQYVKDNYKPKNNQGYSFIVVRTVAEDGVDGYLAFYHYNKKASPIDLYYFYYFCIEY